MSQQKVTILGAGIVGICTALSLAERGVAVTVIDRGDPGQETSYGNAGVISPASIVPMAMPGLGASLPKLFLSKSRAVTARLGSLPRLARWGLQTLGHATEEKAREVSAAMDVLCAPSISLYERHLKGTGAEGLLVPSMYVHAFRDGSKVSLDALDYRLRTERGNELELVGADALRRIEPALSHEFEAAVLMKGQARCLSPGRMGAVLADKARGMGVRFERAEVRGVARCEAGWQITCGGQILTAQTLVLSMGAWSPQILEPLGYTTPLITERGYHLHFAEPGIEINNSVMDSDAKSVASSMEGGVRFAGQTEFASVDAPPDPRREARIKRLAKRAFPDLNTERGKIWMGRRPSFPDGLPVLGKVADAPGLFANFGHAHFGLMQAPKSGEIVADIVTKAAPNIDLGAFAFERFAP